MPAEREPIVTPGGLTLTWSERSNGWQLRIPLVGEAYVAPNDEHPETGQWWLVGFGECEMIESRATALRMLDEKLAPLRAALSPPSADDEAKAREVVSDWVVSGYVEADAGDVVRGIARALAEQRSALGPRLAALEEVAEAAAEYRRRERTGAGCDLASTERLGAKIEAASVALDLGPRGAEGETMNRIARGFVWAFLVVDVAFALLFLAGWVLGLPPHPREPEPLWHLFGDDVFSVCVATWLLYPPAWLERNRR